MSTEKETVVDALWWSVGAAIALFAIGCIVVWAWPLLSALWSIALPIIKGLK